MEGNYSQVLQDILETVNFIKDSAVSKEEFGRLETRFDGLTKDVSNLRIEVRQNKEELDLRMDRMEGRFNRRIDDLEDKMTNYFDSFVGMYKKVDIEVASLRSAYNRLEQKIEKTC